MTRYARSLPPSYFDERYAKNLDPWDFETSDYERAKYVATLDALPRARYSSALEVGCSIRRADRGTGQAIRRTREP